MGAACAVELPQPKVGLWETRFQHSTDGKDSGPPAVAQRCLDQAAVARGKVVGDDYIHKNCTKYEVRQEGAAWITDMVCTGGGSTMTSHSATIYAGLDAYHTELTMTYDPPAAGKRTRTVIDGKWLGACKAE